MDVEKKPVHGEIRFESKPDFAKDAYKVKVTLFYDPRRAYLMEKGHA